MTDYTIYKVATHKKRGRKPGPRPDLQKYKPGVECDMRLAFTQMRAQCKYRHELFNITWEDFQAVWQDHWHNRGRASHNVCLKRIDVDHPWDISNIRMITRSEQHTTRHLYGQ